MFIDNKEIYHTFSSSDDFQIRVKADKIGDLSRMPGENQEEQEEKSPSDGPEYKEVDAIVYRPEEVSSQFLILANL